jgi:hypothetical protein
MTFKQSKQYALRWEVTLLMVALLSTEVLFSTDMLFAQTTDSTSSDARLSNDARLKATSKKKKKSLSSDELEGLIQELAKRLKETKEREAEEQEQKRKEVQERISKIQKELEAAQQELSELSGADAQSSAPPPSSAPQAFSSSVSVPSPVAPPTQTIIPTLETEPNPNPTAYPTQSQDRYRPRVRRQDVYSPPSDATPTLPMLTNQEPPPQELSSHAYVEVGVLQSEATSMSISQDKLSTLTALAEGNNIGNYQTGYGMTMIDGANYYTMTLAPEVQFEHWAFGLDASIRLDEQGNLRKEDWQNFDALVRKIRYVRYSSDLQGLFGQTRAGKEGKVFIRLGQLENITLGDGSLVRNYRNNASYDGRKVGAEFKVMTSDWRIEGFASNVSRAEIFGARAELYEKEQNAVILKDLRIGVTGAIDVAREARFFANPLDTLVQNRGDFSEANAGNSAPVGVVGADIRASLWKARGTLLNATAEYAKVLQNQSPDGGGVGGAVGVELFTQNEQGVELALTAKHLYIGERYEPLYFNGFYEEERFRSVETEGGQRIQTKANRVANRRSERNQILLSARISWRNTFSGTAHAQELFMEGSLVRGYETNEGQAYLGAGVSELVKGVSAYIRFYKRLTQDEQWFVLDNNTQIRAEVTARLSERLIVGALYDWTFSPVFNPDGRSVASFSPQRRFEPKVNFNFSF